MISMGHCWTKPTPVFELLGDFPGPNSPELPWPLTDALPEVRHSVFNPQFPYSPDDIIPRPSISSVCVERHPLYKLLILVEDKTFGNAVDAFMDILYKENDFRIDFGIGTLEIRLIDYPDGATRTATSVFAVTAEHIREGKDNLELIVINKRLDGNDERSLGLGLVDIATELEKHHAPTYFLGINFVQIRRSKRLSGNFANNSNLLDNNNLEELQAVCMAHAQGQVKSRLAAMLNVRTACNESDDLLRNLREIMNYIEARHHRFGDFLTSSAF